MIAIIREGARRLTRTKVEFAWVIEDANSSPSCPLYWTGFHEWDLDHEKAIRFSRQCDAEQMAKSVFCDNDYRTAQHGWEV